MKILIVTQYFWPEFFLVNSLATNLQKMGHRVSVLTGLPNYPRGELFKGYGFFHGPWTENLEQVQVLRVPLVPRKKGFFWLAINYVSFVFFGVLPGALRAPKDIDVIFCFGLSPVTLCIPAIVIKWLTKKPLIFWVQDLWPESVVAVGASKSNFILKLIGKVTEWIYSNCDLILIQSQAFKPSLLSRGVSEEKIMYVPNWFESIQPAQIATAPDWLKEAPVGFRVVFAGNIGQAQDMKSILAAASLLREHTEIQWMIVGDGSAKKFVDDEILRRGLQKSVRTYGRRPVEDMPALFLAGDLMLVSLTAEGIFALTVPSKVQAYMSSGKPILAMLNGEGARIVEEAGAGLSCPAENPKILAEKVLQLSQTPKADLLKMGEMGRQYFLKNFEQSVVIGNIEKICRSTAAKH